MKAAQKAANQALLDEAQEKQFAISKEYRMLLNTQPGKIIMADLETVFGETTLKTGPDGMVDINASIAASGAREVLLYIKGRMKHE